MARTASTMLDLGTSAPDFRLPDFNGKQVALSDLAGPPALLVMFICNHCPFVKHIRSQLAQVRRDYSPEALAVVAINPNDVVAYPSDNAENMAKEASEFGYTFPYLLDETQSVAKAYRAACTPDFYLFGPDRTLVYRGQLDDSRPGNNIPLTGRDLRRAIDAVLKSEPARPDQRPSIGCNIKWKQGNAPDYHGT